MKTQTPKTIQIPRNSFGRITITVVIDGITENSRDDYKMAID